MVDVDALKAVAARRCGGHRGRHAGELPVRLVPRSRRRHADRRGPADRRRIRCRRWSAGPPTNKIGIVPRGAGTSLSGGSSAVDGGIVLSLERMRAIEIDTTTRVAVVEPGAFNAEVKAAAAAHGLWYPPDPSSYEICSIGGNIATNAGGLCCVKYGVTTDYVLGLDVVLADGELITLGGKRIKDVAGLAAAEAVRRLGGHARHHHPGDPPAGARAAARATLVATFPDAESAARAVVELGPGRPALDGRADGQRLDQHRRGRAPDGSRPDRRRPARDPVGRTRRGLRGRDRGRRGGLRQARRDRVLRHLRSRRGRAVRGGAARLLPCPGGSRRADAGGRRRPGTPAAGPARRDREDRREPRGRDPGGGARRRRQHPSDDRLRPDRRRREGTGRRSPSPRSWSSPSRSAARSPASMASAG